MKQKLKIHWIKLYLLEAGGRDRMTSSDWEVLGRGIEWRFNLVDRLTAMVRRGGISQDDLLGMASMLTIRRQVESEVQLYQEEIESLEEMTAEGEISQDEFEDILITLTIAILIIAFLLGAYGSRENLVDDKLLLYDASLTVLMSEAGNPREQSVENQARFNAASAVVLNPFFMNNAFTPEELAVLQEQLDASRDSVFKLSQAIAEGKYTGEDSLDISDKFAMWIGTIAYIYSEGQMFSPDNPFLKWILGVAEHCVTCLGLNGVVRTKEEWKRTPFRPRARNGSLACKGYHCQCNWIPDPGPSRGDLPPPAYGLIA